MNNNDNNGRSLVKFGIIFFFIGFCLFMVEPFIAMMAIIIGITLIVTGSKNVSSSIQNSTQQTNTFVQNNILNNNQTQINNATTVAAAESTQPVVRIIAKKEDYNPIYNLSEKDMVEKFIKDNLAKTGIDINTKMLPRKVVNKKRFLNILFAVLLFIYISLIFFHFPMYTYIIGAVILLFAFIKTRKYTLIKYLKKQLEARPSEKVTNIIMSEQATFTRDNSGMMLAISILASIVLPLIIFFNPVIIYEKVDGGYAVRYYAFGITNFKSATIPAEHNGQKVVSLRGNTFSNMSLLTEVNLPDTITEIRGQAFKNTAVVTVELPSNLEYLGGGAFANCDKLERIVLPDSLTYLGGEAFSGDSSLKSIKLSNNLEEIRGNTFEYCTSLTSVDIPDSVTRIGGHAFYGDYSLSQVNFTRNSKLTEIGSSAFRRCTSLRSITIPKIASVNSRAFKESPTNIEYFDDYNSYYNDYSTFDQTNSTYNTETSSEYNFNIKRNFKLYDNMTFGTNEFPEITLTLTNINYTSEGYTYGFDVNGDLIGFIDFNENRKEQDLADGIHMEMLSNDGYDNITLVIRYN